LTRPTYSSMIFGLLPGASMRVGCEIRMGMILDRNKQHVFQQPAAAPLRSYTRFRL
jgi:hypothetical protein